MRQVIIICFVVLVSGCIDPINLEIPNGDGTLVVDGLITDQPGPYTVKLSRSIDFDNSRPLRVFSVPEKGATVKVTDSNGATETLVERKPGVYETLGLQGRVGTSYQMSIQTIDGKKYLSTTEVLPAAPVMKRIEQEFDIYDRLFVNTNGVPRIARMEGFYIYAVTDDPRETENFYRWQADGIFEYFSLTDNSDIKQCWAPLRRLEDRIILADDLHFDGQTFRQFVCIVPYERPTKFLVKLRQQSLTAEAHRFWVRSAAQQSSTGSLFDPPPAAISGNVVNEADSDETVLGYFGASSIVKFELLIDRFKAAGLVAAHPEKAIRPGDCRQHEPEGTNVKPEGF
jgi:hypothetical protein